MFKTLVLFLMMCISPLASVFGTTILCVKNDSEKSVSILIEATGSDRWGKYKGQAFSESSYDIKPGLTLCFANHDLLEEYSKFENRFVVEKIVNNKLFEATVDQYSRTEKNPLLISELVQKR